MCLVNRNGVGSHSSNVFTHAGKTRGFTLIELVVVIAILGILSATALPKFVNLVSGSGGARYAALQGQAAAFQAGVVSIQAAWMAAGSASSGTISMANGTTLTVGSTATATNVYGGTFTSGTTPAQGAIMIDASLSGSSTSALWAAVMQGPLPSLWLASSGALNLTSNASAGAFTSSPAAGQETFYYSAKTTCGFTYSQGDMSVYLSAAANC